MADTHIRVITKDRTTEERGMILVGLRMIKGVTKVVPDPDNPKLFTAHVSDMSLSVIQAMIVIEGVVKTERVKE